MLFRILAISVFSLTTFTSLPQLSAETYSKLVNGREVIVHTNAAPVIVHRLLPPFYGKHVTERQLKVGRLPPAARR